MISAERPALWLFVPLVTQGGSGSSHSSEGYKRHHRPGRRCKVDASLLDPNDAGHYAAVLARKYVVAGLRPSPEKGNLAPLTAKAESSEDREGGTP
jgi:hypothetical protein